MQENNKETRKVYLYTLYFSYYSLMFVGFYEFINLMLAYLYHEDNEDKGALKLSGFFLSVYGVIGMFLMLGF